MKKLILSILVIAAMTSCTKSSDEEIDPNAPVEIKMNAKIETTVALGRSAVNQLSEATLTDFAFFRADGDQEGTNLDWTSEPLNAGVEADGTIKFTPTQYYNPVATIYAHFIGIYPKSAGSIATGKFTFTTEQVNKGQTDIMYATKVSGNKNKTDNLAIKFDHALSQLKFKFAKGTSFTSTNATVTSITIKGTKLPKEMNLSTGVITYNDATEDIKLTFNTNNTIGGATAPTEVIMIDPNSTGIKADITIQDGESILTFNDIAINVTPNKGESNEIELTFEQKEVSGQASITEWTIGAGGTGTVM